MGGTVDFIRSLAKINRVTETRSVPALENRSRVFSKEFSRVRNRINAERQSNIPRNLDAIFKEASSKYNVPENLIKAVAYHESGFRSQAVSPAGAAGIMQLMPATASGLGVSNRFDPRQSIMGGAKLLSGNLKKYGGNIPLALAAYNAGPGNVAKYGGVPPFRETKNYIKRITDTMKSGKFGQTLETATSKYVKKTDSATINNENGLQNTRKSWFTLPYRKVVDAPAMAAAIKETANIEVQEAKREFYLSLADSMRVSMNIKVVSAISDSFGVETKDGIRQKQSY